MLHNIGILKSIHHVFIHHGPAAAQAAVHNLNEIPVDIPDRIPGMNLRFLSSIGIY